MKFDNFKQLFLSHLETAACNAEEQVEKTVPRNFEIELYATGYSGDIVDINEALAGIFITEDNFYRVIDVAVIGISKSVTRVFVRVSGHPPASFQDTWNTPKGNGPFKQILAHKIQEVDD